MQREFPDQMGIRSATAVQFTPVCGGLAATSTWRLCTTEYRSSMAGEFPDQMGMSG